MTSLYLSRLSTEERILLLDKLLESQLHKCFICGQEIDRTVHHKLHIDHVEPLKLGGKDNKQNFAATHDVCNQSKQASDLRVARILCRFDQITQSIEGEGRSPNLGDVLKSCGGSKHELTVNDCSSHIKTSLDKLGLVEVKKMDVFEDALSGFRYFFMLAPIEYLHHDDKINPRPIGRNLRQLVEEFHKKFPQLHVALGWVNASHPTRIRVSTVNTKRLPKYYSASANSPSEYSSTPTLIDC